MGLLEEVRSLYEARPYPAVGLLSPFYQRIRRADLPLLNYTAAVSSVYGSLQNAALSPRILVAGCGTFEPIVVALANPTAEIVAVDLSESSLRRLRWLARLYNVGSRIKTVQADLMRLSREGAGFDYLIATGVVHHLPDPLAGFQKLRELGSEFAVFRFMIYSRWGRDLLYRAKDLAQKLGVSEPKAFRKLMAALPSDHPYKIYFHLYSDAATDDGLCDGFLHPSDHPFTALQLMGALASAGLRAEKFLHYPEGQPKKAEERSSKVSNDWEKLALLEALGELNENFLFFAGVEGTRRNESPTQLQWNECLPKKGKVFSKILGKRVSVDRTMRPEKLPANEKNELLEALFLVRGSRK